MIPADNFADDSTDQLSWHLQNYDLIKSGFDQDNEYHSKYELINLLWNRSLFPHLNVVSHFIHWIVLVVYKVYLECVVADEI